MLDPKTEARLGPILRATERPGEHGNSQVYRVELKTGEAVFVKQLSARAFQQETAFYRNLAPRLKNVPRMLEADEEQRMIILTEISGTTVEAHHDPEQLHRQAGSFLRALHGLEFQDQDTLPVSAALLKRLEAFAREAGKQLKPGYLDELKAQIRSLVPHIHSQRVPCHRDFMDYNWLQERDGTLCVIDFEHARPDYWLLDLCKMNALVWVRSPQLKHAFFQGYGYKPSDWEESLLHLWSVIWSVGTLQWALKHGDGRYEHKGREAASVLGASLRL